MATKSGRSKTGTKKQPARANAKRGSVSAKKAASKRPKKSAAGRQKKVAYGSREPRFFLIFKQAKAPHDIYLVAVYDYKRLTNSNLTGFTTLSDLERALGALPVTVEFAHLLKKNDELFEIFRDGGPTGLLP